MTKSKSQLRAEAVERLKNSVGARLKPDAAVIAIVGGRIGQADWSLECDKLIDLLLDEPTNGIEGETNGIPSDSPLDAQSRAEIEDMERSRAVSGDSGQDADADSAEGAKADQDTREKLLEDLERQVKYWRKYDGNYMRIYSTVAYAQVKELLDRQEAITERECFERGVFDLGAHQRIAEQDSAIIEYAEKNAELTEQLESAHAKNRSLKAHIAKMQEGRHGWHVKYPALQKKNAELQAKVDELTAERDQYRDNMLAQARMVGEVTAERDMYRENLEAESNRTCTLAYDGKWLICSECGESLQWFGVRTIYKDGTQERALGVDGVKYCAFCGARIEVDE